MSKTYRLEWTTSAKNDLLTIVAYIKKDSPSAANAVYQKIREKAHSSSFFPLKGRIVPELHKESITLYREVIAAPWRIVYKVGNGVVYIMAILDSRQNSEEVLLQKIIKE